MRFRDLFRLGKDLEPIEQEKLKGELFDLKFNSISQNRMRLWKINQEVSTTERRYLLGVNPSWNFYDLYLLDCIDNALRTKNGNEIFEVFNLDSLIHLSELSAIFGDIKSAQPPILGIWEGGIFLKSIWGWDAKRFLIDKYKFIWSPSTDDYLG